MAEGPRKPREESAPTPRSHADPGTSSPPHVRRSDRSQPPRPHRAPQRLSVRERLARRLSEVSSCCHILVNELPLHRLEMAPKMNATRLTLSQPCRPRREPMREGTHTQRMVLPAPSAVLNLLAAYT